MQVNHLRVNHLENPIGFELKDLTISYLVTGGKGEEQKASQIQIALDEKFQEIVYDTGMIEGMPNCSVPILMELQPRTRYFYQVKVQDNLGEEGTSAVAFFETGKMEEEWSADFITLKSRELGHPILVKSFVAKAGLQKARFYGLGLGIYELYLNGNKVSDEYLLPGLHVYDRWLQYQTFELDVVEGINTVEVMLGDGWYKGAYGLKSQLPRYGDRYAFIGEIYLTYDGEEDRIVSDISWVAKSGKVTFDSIYDGEKRDDTLSTGKIYPVELIDLDKYLLVERLSPRILVHEKIKPIEVIKTPKGEIVLDFGQNLVGWVEFRVHEKAGASMHLQYGEILQEGNFYRDNLRKAKCEYVYISDGNEKLVRPYFTFYGFRYIKVEGNIGDINPEDYTAWVIHSEMEVLGQITTSNPLVNRLFENVKWGQKGNFLDIPTDCPQRDERMGWTGDAQIFADTATYNMDTYAFYKKFMKDLRLEQAKLGGSVPYVVPMSAYELHGATTWGDAATVIPWVSYVHTGDISILIEQFNSMKEWVEYIKRADDATGEKRLWTTGRHFGDWLALDGKVDGGVYGSTDKYFIASAFYYYSAMIVAKTAKILGKDADFKYYDQLAGEVKNAFIEEYFTMQGRLSVDTQTAYAIVIYMELYKKEWEERLTKDFNAKMKENNFKLNTGFVGTPYLCLALSKCGLNELAYELLLNEEFPGWLYEVNMGATTIWERWNSVLPDGSISGTGMNSLNHYAYGSIAAWMYRYMVGISPTEENPGFKKAIIAPNPSYRMKQVACFLKTSAGNYKVEWKLLEDNRFVLIIEVPFDAKAELKLPRACGVTVHMEKYPLSENKEISIDEILLGTEGENVFNTFHWIEPAEYLVTTLSAGTYLFVYEPNQPYAHQFNLESNFNVLMANSQAKDIILKYFPRAERGIPFQGEATIIEEILQSPFAEVEDENVRKIKEELGKIKSVEK